MNTSASTSRYTKTSSQKRRLTDMANPYLGSTNEGYYYPNVLKDKPWRTTDKKPLTRPILQSTNNLLLKYLEGPQKKPVRQILTNYSALTIMAVYAIRNTSLIPMAVVAGAIAITAHSISHSKPPEL